MKKDIQTSSNDSRVSNGDAAASVSAHPTRATEAFYGRRKGLKLHEGQARAVAEWLPKLNLDLDNPCSEKLTDLFGAMDKPPTEFRLEIGFGGGEHLLHQARLNPEIGYIGIEPFENGMAKAITAISKEGIKNIRVYNDDATRVLDWLPEGCLNQIDLLYPDPWPKKRHWKRRFVSQKNLTRFHRVLKPGHLFRFASDIDTYVNWTLNHCHTHGGFDWQADQAADWHNPWENWIRTRYEAKAIREGRTPCYMIFKRV